MTLPEGITFRPAAGSDLAACEDIWRESLNHYLLPLGQQEIPPDNKALRLLHAHALATDPSLFWVAMAPDDAGPGGGSVAPAVVAFASAMRRGQVWFLSMLFVRPGRQLGGIGRALLERTLPTESAVTLAVATDPAQPISNGLYASVGMVPRLPMFNLIGRPMRPDGMPTLPDAVRPTRFDAGAQTTPSAGSEGLDLELGALDRDLLGFAHPQDHEFVRRQGRIGFAYRDRGGSLVGYGYTSEVGRIGPVAARDATLLAPIVAHLLTAVPPRGASAIWVPGDSGSVMQMLLRAGLRMEGFPVLLGWSRAFADFGRYMPTSPGIL